MWSRLHIHSDVQTINDTFEISFHIVQIPETQARIEEG
jgi:hypothetical protein